MNQSLLTCIILLESGESLEVEGLSPNTTVRELKETILDLDARFPLQNQWLSYDGAQLVEDKTLVDYGIKNLCVINLDSQRKGVMRKPVILLYPPSVLEEVSVRVRLACDMKFSALRPKPYNVQQRSGEHMVSFHAEPIIWDTLSRATRIESPSTLMITCLVIRVGS